MSAGSLLKNFETIAEAPGGVERLRDLVLTLAVRGRLTDQAKEEPARILLARVADVRERFVRAGQVRRPKNVAPPAPGEFPFELPRGWEWARLGTVTGWPLTDGDWIESKDQNPAGDVRLIQLADVGVGEFRDRSSRFLTSTTANRLGCTFLEPGDVLIARLPEPLGRACVFPGDPKPSVTAVDVAIARCGEDGLMPSYLTIAMNSRLVREQVLAFGTGTTRLRVSTSNLATCLLPVPPLAEQRRIAAKVDELIALCNELEKKQERLRDLSARLAEAVVAAV